MKDEYTIHVFVYKKDNAVCLMQYEKISILKEYDIKRHDEIKRSSQFTNKF